MKCFLERKKNESKERNTERERERETAVQQTQKTEKQENEYIESIILLLFTSHKRKFIALQSFIVKIKANSLLSVVLSFLSTKKNNKNKLKPLRNSSS